MPRSQNVEFSSARVRAALREALDLVNFPNPKELRGAISEPTWERRAIEFARSYGLLGLFWHNKEDVKWLASCAGVQELWDEGEKVWPLLLKEPLEYALPLGPVTFARFNARHCSYAEPLSCWAAALWVLRCNALPLFRDKFSKGRVLPRKSRLFQLIKPMLDLEWDPNHKPHIRIRPKTLFAALAEAAMNPAAIEAVKLCVGCGKAFVATRAWSRWCSDNCKWRISKRQQRERIALQGRRKVAPDGRGFNRAGLTRG